jgi:tRNA pseudouridine38-40 synthase
VSAKARRVRIDLAYDGTDFCGWQLQPRQRSVQGVVEQALAELHGGERVVVNGASRTDAGVHAQRQVADCLVRLRHDDAGLAYALRRLLPADVRPLAVTTTAREFHSRKDARSKIYHYRIDRSAHGDPFTVRYALHHPAALDDARVREGLALLPGRHDWTGFASPRHDKEDAVRTLGRAEAIGAGGGETVLVFEGEGFLRYMVRNIVGTLIEIGKGRMPVESVTEILARRDPDLAGPTAPPHGLHLVRVRYADDPP